MKKILFLLFLSYQMFLVADSLDNAAIEQTRMEKEQKKNAEKKAQSQEKSTEKTTQNEENENSKNKDSEKNKEENAKEKDSIKQDSKQSTEESQENSHQSSTKKAKKRMYWFAGGYIGSNVKALYQGQDAQTFDIQAQFGALYYIGINHGAKFLVYAGYTSIINENLAALGLGIDYFYNFKRFGIFAGASLNKFLNSNVIKDIDIIVNAGVSYTASEKVRIEAQVGYPVMNDADYERMLTIGVNIYYMF